MKQTRIDRRYICIPIYWKECKTICYKRHVFLLSFVGFLGFLVFQWWQTRQNNHNTAYVLQTIFAKSNDLNKMKTHYDTRIASWFGFFIDGILWLNHIIFCFLHKHSPLKVWTYFTISENEWIEFKFTVDVSDSVNRILS